MNILKKPTIVLHLGIHKTATTHIQSRLKNSIDILMKHNIGYIPLQKLRNMMTTKLNDKTISASSMRKSFEPYMCYDRLIISDENILGTAIPSNNKVYPDIIPRLKKILNIFEDYPIEVHITLRNYVPFMISRYTEILRHRDFMEFKNYYADIDFNTISWLDLLNQLQKAGIKNIIVTPFENLFINEQSYLEQLVDKKGLTFNAASDSPEIRRSKFSQEGYDVIKFYSQHFSRKNTKQIANLIDHTTQNTPVKQFMPFSKEQQEQLSIRYNKEISMLKNTKLARNPHD